MKIFHIMDEESKSLVGVLFYEAKKLLYNADMGRNPENRLCPFVTIHKSYISF